VCADGRAAGASKTRRRGHAPGPDERGRRDRPARGAFRAIRHRDPGHQRRGGAHGAPVPPQWAARMIRLVGGRVIDPGSGRDAVADLCILDGALVEHGSANGETVIDVSGYVVAPGFVDLHCHLREPGFEDAETVATGTHAAAAGGFTTLCALADTHPSTDTGSDVESMLTLARRDALVRVLPVGTTTKQRNGE